jgi:alpha-beta hydrolase superfamily lysophospholipase
MLEAGSGGLYSLIIFDYSAQLTSIKGYTVIGLDLEGHGRSDGILVYIPSFLRMAEGAHEVFQSFRGTYTGQKWFLAGEVSD